MPRHLRKGRTGPPPQGVRLQTAGSCISTALLRTRAPGAGAVLISPTQDKLYYAVQLCFQHGEKVSNNMAEYEGLIAGLKVAGALGVKRLTVKGDSQLLVNFSNKVYEPEDKHMEAYLAEVRKMEKQFSGVGVKTSGSRVGGPELCV